MSLNVVYGLGVEDGIRVRGGPDWVRSERYTIDAIASSAADVETMRGPMLLALLEERFRLKAHIEAEQIPAFELTVAKGGLKLRPGGTGACAPLSEIGSWRPRGFADVRRGEKPTCGLFGFRNGSNTVTVGGEITLDALVRQLSTPPGGTFDAPLGGVRVIDKTGITDTFNFVLEYVRDGSNLADHLHRMSSPQAFLAARVSSPRSKSSSGSSSSLSGLRASSSSSTRSIGRRRTDPPVVNGDGGGNGITRRNGATENAFVKKSSPLLRSSV